MSNISNTLDASTACPQPPPATSRPRRARRSASLDSIAMTSKAAEFCGLPEGVKHPDQLLETFKAAAPALKIPKGVLALVDHLYKHTGARDWQAGTRPLAWPSNQKLMHDLGCKPTALGQAARTACTMGLVVMKDSPTGRRYGRRHDDGRIDEEHTFGFDLTPLALRFAEFKAAADGYKAHHAQRVAARRQVTREREALLQIIDTAAEQGVWTQYWEDVAKRAEDTRAMLTPTLPLAETQHVAQCLANWRAEARAMLDQAMANPVDEAGDGAAAEIRTEAESESRLSENRQLKNTTNSTHEFAKANVVVEARQGVVARGPGSDPNPATPPVEPSRGRGDKLPGDAETILVALEGKGMTPVRVREACPVLAATVGPDPSWRDLGEACGHAAAHYGISARTWARAVAVLGPQASVIIFASMASFPAGHFSKGPGAWFASMIQRQQRGELSMAQVIGSFHGMRTRTEAGMSPSEAPQRAATPSTWWVERKRLASTVDGLRARMTPGGEGRGN